MAVVLIALCPSCLIAARSWPHTEDFGVGQLVKGTFVDGISADRVGNATYWYAHTRANRLWRDTGLVDAAAFSVRVQLRRNGSVVQQNTCTLAQGGQCAVTQATASTSACYYYARNNQSVVIAMHNGGTISLASPVDIRRPSTSCSLQE